MSLYTKKHGETRDTRDQLRSELNSKKSEFSAKTKKNIYDVFIFLFFVRKKL